MDLSSALQHSETMSGAPVAELPRHCDGDVTEPRDFAVVMRIHRVPVLAVALFLALIVVTFMSRPALADDSTARSTSCSCDPNCYNTDYLFAATRELHDSTGSPTLVAVLSPLTVALDIGLLPFEVFLGFFG